MPCLDVTVPSAGPILRVMSKGWEYSPSQLGSIDEVDVVDLRGAGAGDVGKYMEIADRPSVTVKGPKAEEIAELFRALPKGDQARCHTPPFGLRFRRGRKVVTEASICWECDNIFGTVGKGDLHYEFDAGAEPSKKLLALLKDVHGG